MDSVYLLYFKGILQSESISRIRTWLHLGVFVCSEHGAYFLPTCLQKREAILVETKVIIVDNI